MNKHYEVHSFIAHIPYTYAARRVCFELKYVFDSKKPNGLIIETLYFFLQGPSIFTFSMNQIFN